MSLNHANEMPGYILSIRVGEHKSFHTSLSSFYISFYLKSALGPKYPKNMSSSTKNTSKMDGLSPQECARVAVQEIISLALAIKPGREGMTRKWQLMPEWAKVIPQIFEIHTWSTEDLEGETLGLVRKARAGVNDILWTFKLSYFADKMQIQDLGKKLEAESQVFNEALAEFGMKAEDERGVKLAKELRADFDAALHGCGGRLAFPHPLDN